MMLSIRSLGVTMANQWKDEKCGTCDFKVCVLCRKNPPTLEKLREFIVGELGCRTIDACYQYPIVSENTDACSYWREKEY